MKLKQLVLFLSVCFLTFTTNAHALVVINEFLADPPSGLSGDANGDGTGSTSQDEFIELFNSGANPVDLTNYSLSDALKVRHVFASGTTILPNDYVVVFGGGTPVNGLTASTGSLGLNNGGDTISLFSSSNTLIDQVSYGSEGGDNQSLALNPEGVPGNFAKHSTIAQANGALFSPGTSLNGQSTQNVQTTVTPEPATMGMLLLGGLGALVRQRRKNN